MFLIHSLKLDPSKVTFPHKFIRVKEPLGLEPEAALFEDIRKEENRISLDIRESLIKHPNVILRLGSNHNII